MGAWQVPPWLLPSTAAARWFQSAGAMSSEGGSSRASGTAVAGGWPDFFIVGAPKAGTTALDALLRRVPGVSMAAVKEPRFFMSSIDPSCFFTPCVRDPADYLRLWPSGPGLIRGEASPTYLMDPAAPAAIAEVRPDARIVVALRDPVERAFSHFRYHELRTGRSTRAFSTAIRAERNAPLLDYHRSYLIEPGFYGKHLTRWLDTFGPASLHVVLLDDLMREPRAVLERLGAFLGVEVPADLDVRLSAAKRNKAAVLRWPWLRRLTMSTPLRAALRRTRAERLAVFLGERLLLSAATADQPPEPDRRFLEGVYRPDAERLCELLGRDLPWFAGRWIPPGGRGQGRVSEAPPARR